MCCAHSLVDDSALLVYWVLLVQVAVGFAATVQPQIEASVAATELQTVRCSFADSDIKDPNDLFAIELDVKKGNNSSYMARVTDNKTRSTCPSCAAMFFSHRGNFKRNDSTSFVEVMTMKTDLNDIDDMQFVCYYSTTSGKEERAANVTSEPADKFEFKVKSLDSREFDLRISMETENRSIFVPVMPNATDGDISYLQQDWSSSPVPYILVRQAGYMRFVVGISKKVNRLCGSVLYTASSSLPDQKLEEACDSGSAEYHATCSESTNVHTTGIVLIIVAGVVVVAAIVAVAVVCVWKRRSSPTQSKQKGADTELFLSNADNCEQSFRKEQSTPPIPETTDNE